MERLADKLYPRIRGKMVPAETFDEVMPCSRLPGRQALSTAMRRFPASTKPSPPPRWR
jgi:hypothetical protein